MIFGKSYRAHKLTAGNGSMSSFKKYNKEMCKDSMYSQVLPEFDMGFKSTILVDVLTVGAFSWIS